jgi:hypothetical protein
MAPMSTAAREEAPELLPPQVDAATLSKYFTLSEADLAEVKRCRGAVNKVGFAVQLCMLRWRGYFLKDAGAVPWAVLETLTHRILYSSNCRDWTLHGLRPSKSRR